ncbi:MULTISPECIES: anthranilate synthase component I family protein [unclassified Microbacterium]|uniref:anthranilate synthase component I family protein n=1 Tax=unclassified Microbacterium TaxID=2609290 RepID=UPI000EA9CA81|nr:MULTISPECIES: anthranilate synthase component I family protein [unclassified Microbacterium]MBT2486224.1 anthranilate synthase component I family protein [Microbacterium sp. ISL-108]RKN68943.1 anthranilate synthase component I family protein [Microbacterium sp. CGR2]
MSERLRPRPLPAWVEPTTVFRKLEAEVDDVFWLDAGTGAAEGWSFVGTGERSALGEDVRLDVSAVTAADTGIAEVTPPFVGGWVGWRDYERGARDAGAPVNTDGGDERPSWLRATRVVAFDHAAKRAWTLSTDEDADEWTAVVERATAPTPSRGAGRSDTPTRIAEAGHDPREYGDLIERCRALIRAGTAYQLCLTTRFTVAGDHDAVAVYERLRAATPAHHGGFVRIGGRALLSASPEQFLQSAGGVIRTRPIKGTRPRHADPQKDAALAAELATDPKERAENVMIVDLMRNDLSQVCVPGSIRVDALWKVESYPAVHQLVSTVSGTAAEGLTVGALLMAAFPAGSMTGAPKLSAMTRLHELEGGPRGIYAGCFGYVGIDGALDLAMVIRSIVIDGGEAVVGAGGGITWGSIAAAEVAEVATKARAPLAALGAEMPVPWRSDILS